MKVIGERETQRKQTNKQTNKDRKGQEGAEAIVKG